VALASLSGRSDAAWARAGLPHVGAAFLGGIAIDEATRGAARAMVDRGREEFLPPDPVAFVGRQLDALADAPLRPAVNVRTATLGPLRRVARACAARGAVLEVNAHCRQAEMCAAGCGESLLREPGRLTAQVAAAAGVGRGDARPTVSVKLRTELAGVDLPSVARRAVAAGADWIHVDAMDSEAVVADVVAAVRDADPTARVIANNGVRDGPSTREYLRYGADAVSVGRASDEPATLAAVRRATEAAIDDRSFGGTVKYRPR
jgi:TIM-barrel protein